MTIADTGIDKDSTVGDLLDTFETQMESSIAAIETMAKNPITGGKEQVQQANEAISGFREQTQSLVNAFQNTNAPSTRMGYGSGGSSNHRQGQ